MAGFGGLDSKLVALRVSPGELVKVTNGANAGAGGGDVHVTNIIRNSIAADEILLRSSRETRAAVVATALTRGGRHAPRALE